MDFFSILITLVFAVFQLGFFTWTLKQLSKYKGFLPNSRSYEVNEIDGQYSLTAGSDTSEDFRILVDEINEYLKKNEGTADFAFIKEKVQDKLDTLYEEATSKVSYPTYLGLLGTFLGVIIGLINFNVGVHDAGAVSNDAVSSLISGVIISMATSLVGLVLMIAGNWKASSVSKSVEEDKNKFFDFIVVNLMPALGTSMVDALAKLHRTVNSFEPAFRSIIGEFKTAFSECTKELRGTFGENVKLLTDAVETMGSNMTLVNDNVKLQDQLLKTMKQKETLQTIEKFISAAEKFDSVTTSINQLSEIKEGIAASSTQLVAAQSAFVEKLSIPERVFDKINAILDRISIFEESINALGINIAQTQLLGNNQMNLIQEQITAIQKKTQLATDYQDIAEGKLESLYKTQSQSIETLNSQYRAALERHGDDFEAAMKDFKAAYERIVQECQNAVEAKRDAFMEEIRKSLDLEAGNQHLSKLDKIPELIDLLSSIQLSVKEQPAIVSKLSEVSSKIDSTNTKLDSIKGKTSENVTTRPVSPENPRERTGLFGIFNKKKRGRR